ncbi:MAG: serine protease, partial [Staphylococcus xylosus]|nr:serine protease [Staphylococcus xylosus]
MSDHKDMNQQNIDASEDKEHQSYPKTFKFKRSYFILLLLATVIITVVITVFATIGISNWKSGLTSNQRQEVQKIEEVYKTLNNEYYKDTNPEKLSSAAIDGMVKDLDDPYSDYMTKDET